MDLTPKHNSNKFQCPHCGIASQHTWFDRELASSASNKILNNTYLEYRTKIQDYKQEAIAGFIKVLSGENNRSMEHFIPKGFSVATCSSCEKPTLWIDGAIVYPRTTAIPPPNPDLSEGIQNLYREAACIFTDSPKGAAALLRLALQHLLCDLGKGGKILTTILRN